jgi:hypothetical protein
MSNLSLIKEQGPCPPDGFRYIFPEDGWVCHAWTYNDWIAFAKAHLVANSLPVPDDLEASMQNQLCQTLPPGWCDYDDPNRPRVSTSIDWNDLQTGLTTFAKWVQSGFQTVSQDEADRRALICSRCYLNVNVQGCAACGKAVETVTRNKKSKYDFALRSCAVCKCFLRAKIHFPISTLDTQSTNQQLYPSSCWLKKGGENYRG